MKRHRRILAAVLPLMLLLQTGCSNPLDPHNSDLDSFSSESGYTFPRYSVDVLQQKIESLQGIWHEEGMEGQIRADIQSLLDEENRAYAYFIRAEMDYRTDWSDQALYEAYSVTWEDYSVADEMLSWAFANGYRYSSYKDLFAPLINESWIDYYIVNNLSRVISDARSTSSSNAELMDSYYDTAYDSDMSIEESNAECAKLYLDILKTYDLSDFMYSRYFRDYTVEQASQAAALVLEEILPLCQQLYDEVLEDPVYLRLSESGGENPDPFETLRQYAPRISPYVAESANLLLDKKLYRCASGDDCYDGCYTVCLPGEHLALMYLYRSGTFYDFLWLVHEFGHFHSDWRDNTPVYQQMNCIDIAEAQSQGMEMLFTAFYPEIFGDDAVFMEKMALYDVLSSVVSGLAIGEFEYRVMQKADQMSPDDVLDCYNEIADLYHLNMEFYSISHLFEQPGYYVSYGISALPAIQLYAMMQEDFDQAVSVYEKLSGTSSFSGEVFFSEAMQSCGFRDAFDEDTFSYISEIVTDRIRQWNAQ